MNSNSNSKLLSPSPQGSRGRRTQPVTIRKEYKEMQLRHFDPEQFEIEDTDVSAVDSELSSLELSQQLKTDEMILKISSLIENIDQRLKYKDVILKQDDTDYSSEKHQLEYSKVPVSPLLVAPHHGSKNTLTNSHGQEGDDYPNFGFASFTENYGSFGGDNGPKKDENIIIDDITLDSRPQQPIRTGINQRAPVIQIQGLSDKNGASLSENQQVNEYGSYQKPNQMVNIPADQQYQFNERDNQRKTKKDILLESLNIPDNRKRQNSGDNDPKTVRFQIPDTYLSKPEVIDTSNSQDTSGSKKRGSNTKDSKDIKDYKEVMLVIPLECLSEMRALEKQKSTMTRSMVDGEAQQEQKEIEAYIEKSKMVIQAIKQANPQIESIQNEMNARAQEVQSIEREIKIQKSLSARKRGPIITPEIEQQVFQLSKKMDVFKLEPKPVDTVEELKHKSALSTYPIENIVQTTFQEGATKTGDIKQSMVVIAPDFKANDGIGLDPSILLDKSELRPPKTMKAIESVAEERIQLIELLDNLSEKMGQTKTEKAKELKRDIDQARSTLQCFPDTFVKEEKIAYIEIMKKGIENELLDYQDIDELRRSEIDGEKSIVDFNNEKKVENLCDIIRTVNVLGQSSTQQVKNIVNEEATLQRLAKMKKVVEQEEQLEKWQDPNLLEMWNLRGGDDDPKVYELIKDIGKEVLPPRVISAQPDQSSDLRYHFYVPNNQQVSGIMYSRLQQTGPVSGDRKDDVGNLQTSKMLNYQEDSDENFKFNTGRDGGIPLRISKTPESFKNRDSSFIYDSKMVGENTSSNLNTSFAYKEKIGFAIPLDTHNQIEQHVEEYAIYTKPRAAKKIDDKQAAIQLAKLTKDAYAIMEDLKEANSHSPEVQKKVEKDLIKVQELELRLSCLDDDSSPEDRKKVIACASKVVESIEQYKLKELQLDSKQKRKAQIAFGQISAIEIMKNAEQDALIANGMGSKPSDLGKSIFADEEDPQHLPIIAPASVQKEVEQTAVITFLKNFADEIDEKEELRDLEIAHQVKETSKLILTPGADLGESEQQGMILLVKEAVKKNFVIAQEEKDSKKKSEQLEEFTETLRCVNTVGNIKTDELLDMISDPKLKQKLVNKVFQIPPDQDSSAGNKSKGPISLLEMASLAKARNLPPQEAEEMLELIREVGEDILPPRMVDADQMDEEFDFFVPKYDGKTRKYKVPISKSCLMQGEGTDFDAYFKNNDKKTKEKPQFISRSFVEPKQSEDDGFTNVVSLRIPFAIPISTHSKIQELKEEQSELFDESRVSRNSDGDDQPKQEELVAYLKKNIVIINELEEANEGEQRAQEVVQMRRIEAETLLSQLEARQLPPRILEQLAEKTENFGQKMTEFDLNDRKKLVRVEPDQDEKAELTKSIAGIPLHRIAAESHNKVIKEHSKQALRISFLDIDPEQSYSSSEMDDRVMDEQDRLEVIAFLKALSEEMDHIPVREAKDIKYDLDNMVQNLEETPEEGGKLTEREKQAAVDVLKRGIEVEFMEKANEHRRSPAAKAGSVEKFADAVRAINSVGRVPMEEEIQIVRDPELQEELVSKMDRIVDDGLSAKQPEELQKESLLDVVHCFTHKQPEEERLKTVLDEEQREQEAQDFYYIFQKMGDRVLPPRMVEADNTVNKDEDDTFLFYVPEYSRDSKNEGDEENSPKHKILEERETQNVIKNPILPEVDFAHRILRRDSYINPLSRHGGDDDDDFKFVVTQGDKDHEEKVENTYTSNIEEVPNDDSRSYVHQVPMINAETMEKHQKNFQHRVFDNNAPISRSVILHEKGAVQEMEVQPLSPRSAKKKQKQVVLVPLKTVADMKNLDKERGKILNDLKKVEKAGETYAIEPLEEYLQLSKVVYSDLKEANPGKNDPATIELNKGLGKVDRILKLVKLSKRQPDSEEAIQLKEQMDDLVKHQELFEIKELQQELEEKRKVRSGLASIDLGKIDNNALQALLAQRRVNPSPAAEEEAYAAAFMKSLCEEVENLDGNHYDHKLIQDDLRTALHKMTTSNAELTPKEKEGMVAALKKGIESDLMEHKGEISSQKRADNITDFADFVRILNTLGQVDLGEVSDMVKDKYIKEELQDEANSKIKAEKINKKLIQRLDPPNLLELSRPPAAEEELNEDIYRLIKDIGSEILPPRAIDHEESDKFILVVPCNPKKTGLQRSQFELNSETIGAHSDREGRLGDLSKIDIRNDSLISREDIVQEFGNLYNKQNESIKEIGEKPLSKSFFGDFKNIPIERHPFALPLKSVLEIKIFKKEFKKAQESKILEGKISKPQAIKMVAICRDIMVEIKEANSYQKSEPVQKEIRNAEVRIEGLQKKLDDYSDDEETDMGSEEAQQQVEKRLIELSRYMLRFDIRQKPESSEDKKIFRKKLAAIPIVQIYQIAASNAEQSSASGLVPPSNHSVSGRVNILPAMAEQMKREKQRATVTRFLEDLDGHLKESPIPEAEDIHRELRAIIRTIRSPGADLSENERTGMVELINKSVLETVRIQQPADLAEAQRAEATYTLIEDLRSIGNLGRVDVLELIKITPEVAVKKALLGQRFRLLEENKLSFVENPNLLEMAEMEADEETTYKVTALIRENILPPRIIDNAEFEEKRLQIYILHPPFKTAEERNIIQMKQVEPDFGEVIDQNNPANKSMERAKDTFVDFERALQNTNKRSSDLLKEIQAHERRGKVEEISQPERISLMERAQKVFGCQADLQRYMAYYQSHLMHDSPQILAQSTTSLGQTTPDQEDLHLLASELLKKRGKYVDLYPEKVKKQDLEEAAPRVSAQMVKLIDTNHKVSKALIDAQFSQPCYNRGLSEVMKLVRKDFVDAKGALRAMNNRGQPSNATLNSFNSQKGSEAALKEDQANLLYAEVIPGRREEVVNLTKAVDSLENTLQELRENSNLLQNKNSMGEKCPEEAEEEEEEKRKGFSDSQSFDLISDSLIRKADRLLKSIDSAKKQEIQADSGSSTPNIQDGELKEKRDKVCEDEAQFKIALNDVDSQVMIRQLHPSSSSADRDLANEEQELSEIEDLANQILDSKKLEDVLQVTSPREEPALSEKVEILEDLETKVEKFRNHLLKLKEHEESLLKQKETNPFKHSLLHETGPLASEKISGEAGEGEVEEENLNMVDPILMKVIKCMTLKQIIISNLSAVPRYTNKDTEKADDHRENIENLIEETKNSTILKLSLLSKLKKVCRKLDDFKAYMKMSNKMSTPETERLALHIDAVSATVDIIYAVKIDTSLEGIKVAMDTLDAEGRKIDILLSDDPELNKQLLQDYQASPEMANVIRRALQSMNTSIVNCTHHLEESLYQKSRDLHQRQLLFDASRILDKKGMGRFNELICELSETIDDSEASNGQKLVQFIMTLREIADIQAINDKLEKLVDQKNLEKVSQDVAYLTQTKYRLMKLANYLGHGVFNININCIELLRQAKGKSRDLFRMEINSDAVTLICDSPLPLFRKQSSNKKKLFAIDYDSNQQSKKNTLDINQLGMPVDIENSFSTPNKRNPLSMEELMEGYLDGQQQFNQIQPSSLEKQAEQQVFEGQYSLIKKFLEIDGQRPTKKSAPHPIRCPADENQRYEGRADYQRGVQGKTDSDSEQAQHQSSGQITFVSDHNDNKSQNGDRNEEEGSVDSNFKFADAFRKEELEHFGGIVGDVDSRNQIIQTATYNRKPTLTQKENYTRKATYTRKETTTAKNRNLHDKDGDGEDDRFTDLEESFYLLEEVTDSGGQRVNHLRRIINNDRILKKNLPDYYESRGLKPGKEGEGEYRNAQDSFEEDFLLDNLQADKKGRQPNGNRKMKKGGDILEEACLSGDPKDNAVLNFLDLDAQEQRFLGQAGQYFVEAHPLDKEKVKAANPLNKPVYIRKYNPFQKPLEKKYGPFSKQGKRGPTTNTEKYGSFNGAASHQAKDLDLSQQSEQSSKADNSRYSPWEMALHQELVPLSQKVDGESPLFLRETRLPRVKPVDVKNVEAYREQVIMSQGPEMQGVATKYNEIRVPVKNFELQELSKQNERYIIANDSKNSQNVIAIIKLAEKSKTNPLIKQVKDPQTDDLEAFVSEKRQLEGLQLITEKEFRKLKPNRGVLNWHTASSLGVDPSSQCVPKNAVNALIKSIKKDAMIVYYEEIGQQIGKKRVVQLKRLQDLIGEDTQFREMEEAMLLMDKITDAKEKQRKGIFVDDLDNNNSYEFDLYQGDSNPKKKAKISKKMKAGSKDPFSDSHTAYDDLIQSLRAQETLDRRKLKSIAKNRNKDPKSRFATKNENGEKDIGETDFYGRNSSESEPDEDIDGDLFSGDEVLDKPQLAQIQSKGQMGKNSINKILRMVAKKLLENKKKKAVPLLNLEAEEGNEDFGFMGITASERERRRKAKELADLKANEDADEDNFKNSLKGATDELQMVKLFKNSIRTIEGEDADKVQLQDKVIKTIDKRFDLLKIEANKRGIKFEDYLFPPNSSSMVNNSRKTEVEYADIPWKNLKSIYEKPVLLKDFTPETLFAPGCIPPELIIVLTSLCQWPDRIKRLFSSGPINDESLYLVKLNVAGQWRATIINEQVPITNNETIIPFVCEPAQHHQGLKVPQDHMFQKREHNKRKEIDLWPQLLAKGLCKSIMNYERLLGQPIHQLLRMLTGMPVREYSNDVLSFEVLRNSFTRNNPTLAKASPEFIRLINNSSSILHGSNQTKLQNWVVYHVISFTSEEDAWVEVGHPHCLNLNPKRWQAGEDLLIHDDWKQHKRFKRKSGTTFWIKFDNFRQYFESTTICRYQEALRVASQHVLSKEKAVHGFSFSVGDNTAMFIELVEEGKPYPLPEHSQFSQMRLYLLKQQKSKGEGLNQTGNQYGLVRAVQNHRGKRALFDVRLRAGEYHLVAGTFDQSGSPQKRYSLILHSTTTIERYKDIPSRESEKIMGKVLANLSLARGSADALTSNNSVKRYAYSSAKLGLCVVCYVNRSPSLYKVVEDLKTEGRFIVNREIEEGRVRIDLPANSKKMIVFRFEREDFKISIIETAIAIKNQSGMVDQVKGKLENQVNDFWREKWRLFNLNNFLSQFKI